MRYTVRERKRRWPRRILYLLISVVIILLVGTVIAQKIYRDSLNPANAADQEVRLVTISTGTSVNNIAIELQNQGIIKSAWAFELYVSAKQDRAALKAGAYYFAPSESTQEIVSQLSDGKIATDTLTILPGQRLSQVEQTFENNGYSQSEVSSAFNPDNYSALPIMTILPSGSSLEGLLFPDTFDKALNTSADHIITESLNEMNGQLTPSVKQAFSKEGLSPYQGLTLASIVEQEVSKQSDRNQVAQVFLSRLHSGMNLGSDVTAYYGSILAGKSPSVSYDSPYNTLLHTGLPPTPISTVSSSSIEAVAHPANTSWLYFVTGDNGVTYFSKTLAQQQQNTQEYCHKLCTQN